MASQMEGQLLLPKTFKGGFTKKGTLKPSHLGGLVMVVTIRGQVTYREVNISSCGNSMCKHKVESSRRGDVCQQVSIKLCIPGSLLFRLADNPLQNATETLESLLSKKQITGHLYLWGSPRLPLFNIHRPIRQKANEVAATFYLCLQFSL